VLAAIVSAILFACFSILGHEMVINTTTAIVLSFKFC